MNRNETLRTDASRGLISRLALLVLIATLAFPALAAAQQTPTDKQYGDTVVQVGQGGNDPSDPSDPGDPSGLSGNVGPLPFTGFDVIAMIAVALAVTGAGLALQRAVARESTDHS